MQGTWVCPLSGEDSTCCVSWFRHGLEKNFQTWNRMRGIKVYQCGRHCENSRPAQGRTGTEHGSLVHFYTQGTRSGIGVLWVICWLNEACILGWGRVRQIPSSYGIGRETGYTDQEDMQSVNSYSMGEGKTIRVWFLSCIPRPSLVLSTLSSLGHYTMEQLTLCVITLEAHALEPELRSHHHEKPEHCN